ncbi:MAG: adenylate/guanylate cyclase domain-containing protein [Vicinamibacterales bacterium]
MASALAGALGLLSFVRNIELKTYDRRVVATARPTETQPDISLVEINDDSLRRMEPLVGRWPWPRLVHAQLIDYLAAGGAKVIVYDVLFTERDHRKFTVGDTEWSGEESDRALVDSTKRAGNVIHAAEASSAELIDPTRALAPALEGIASFNQPFPADSCLERRPVVTPPFPELAAAARAVGHTLFIYDADGPLRRTWPLIRVGDRVIPSLAMAASMVVGGLQAADVHACPALIAWRGPTIFLNPTAKSDSAIEETFSSHSFYDLFYSQQQLLEQQKPQTDPSVFRDRIVIVGVTAQGLKDVFTTPFPEGSIPGPEVHANIIDAWQSQRAIAPGPGWHGVVQTLVLALFVSVVGMFANAWTTGAAAAVALGALAWLSVWMFTMGSWVPVTVPALAIVFAFVGDLTWKYVIEGREKRQVKKLFSRYVAKDVYEQLLADPSRAALGGARRNMTVLFSDVRGFTTLSEKGQPEDVVRQLNEYFSRMVQVLFEHHGTLDKFVGDMVMALFGAPLDDDEHAEHAVQTALAMAAALDALNREWQGRGMTPLDIGIGINTGDMVAGNIGSDTIMSYTVIGDAVNLGARLESLNKEYGTRIIISEATRSRLKGRYDTRPLGEVVVKGKSQAVAIFEVKQP